MDRIITDNSKVNENLLKVNENLLNEVIALNNKNKELIVKNIDLQEQLLKNSFSVSFTKEDMKKCADFWNGKPIEQIYFEAYLNER